MARNPLCNFQKVATSAAAVIAIVGAVSGLSAWGASAIIQLKSNAANACIAERQVDLLSVELTIAANYSKYLDRQLRILRVRLDDHQKKTPPDMDARAHGLQLNIQSVTLLEEMNRLKTEELPRRARALEKCDRYRLDGPWGL